MESAEAGDPEEAPGLTTAQETDCSCCPRHMTRLKALEAASLRDEETNMSASSTPEHLFVCVKRQPGL